MHNRGGDVWMLDSLLPCGVLLEAKFVSAVVHMRTDRNRLVKWASIIWRRWAFGTINPCWCPIRDFASEELMTAPKRHDVRRSVMDSNVVVQIILWQVMVDFWWRTDTLHTDGILWG